MILAQNSSTGRFPFIARNKDPAGLKEAKGLTLENGHLFEANMKAQTLVLSEFSLRSKFRF